MRIENDGQVLLAQKLDHVPQPLQLGLVERLSEFGLQALPEEGKAHGVEALLGEIGDGFLGGIGIGLENLAATLAEFGTGEVDALQACALRAGATGLEQDRCQDGRREAPPEGGFVAHLIPLPGSAGRWCHCLSRHLNGPLAKDF